MPKNVTDLVMTFVDDDEISKINAAKLEQIKKDAKKHKTTPVANNTVDNKPKEIDPALEEFMIRLNLMKNIIFTVYNESYPPITDVSKGLVDLVPHPVPAQKVLDTILGQIKDNHTKSGIEWTENQIKDLAVGLFNEIREIAYLGLINLTLEKDGSYTTFITPKGIIYANSLRYIARPNPQEHYAIYLQVANS